MTMTHMCFIDPDEDEACGAKLRHGELGEPGNHGLTTGMLAFPALIDEDSLQ